MIVLSHRGWWKNDTEQNTETAFRRSFAMGFGIETDIRDFNGQLVISHDIATPDSMSLSKFFRIYNEYKKNIPLALNIKADGLQGKLKHLLNEHKIKNYFVFDMSVPDGLGYVRNKINVFTRQSEIEPTPAFYSDALGVWLDEFERHWIDKEAFAFHFKNRKQVCIVSPELHKRERHEEWRNYKKICLSLQVSDEVMICTDYPEEAERFFNEN